MAEPWLVPAWYYRHFDADHERDVPAEAYGGWQRQSVELAPEHTAVVCMHAWDTGTPVRFPGWWRAVESMPRMAAICREVFPRLLPAVRASGLPLFHVVNGGDYYKRWPGYERIVSLAGPEPAAPEPIRADPALERLRDFRFRNVFYGAHNDSDIRRGFEEVDFPPEARPLESEAIAATSEQLYALCRAHDVNHLVYIGFTVNGCMLLSPGGMVDMSRRGILCSTVREATTAIENRESARGERAKELGLWYVALLFGFVFDLDDLLPALTSLASRGERPEPPPKYV